MTQQTNESTHSLLLKMYKNNSMAKNAEKLEPKVDYWHTLDTALNKNEEIILQLLSVHE